MSDVSQVVAEILAGRYDGSLLVVVEAVQKRLTDGPGQTRWRVTYDDLVVTEESVTVGEIRKLEKLLGVGWMQIDPQTSGEHFAGLLTILLCSRKDMKPKDATDLVEAIPMGDLLSHLDQYELTPAPKD